MNRCLETYSGIYCSPRVLELARLKSFCQTNDSTCRNLQVTPAHVPIQDMADCRYSKEFSVTVSNTDEIQNGNCSTLCLIFDFLSEKESATFSHPLKNPIQLNPFVIRISISVELNPHKRF